MLLFFSCLPFNLVYESSEKIILVMEYASGGELYDYLNERKRVSELEARGIFRQIVSAVHFLHKNRIVHRPGWRCCTKDLVNSTLYWKMGSNFASKFSSTTAGSQLFAVVVIDSSSWSLSLQLIGT